MMLRFRRGRRWQTSPSAQSSVPMRSTGRSAATANPPNANLTSNFGVQPAPIPAAKTRGHKVTLVLPSQWPSLSLDRARLCREPRTLQQGRRDIRRHFQLQPTATQVKLRHVLRTDRPTEPISHRIMQPTTLRYAICG